MKRSPFNADAEDIAGARLDPAIQAELDQLDAALRGEPIEDDVLASLVRDVQATAPEMPSDLRKQLRHDVASGFSRGGFRGRLSAAAGRTGTRGAGGPRSFKLLTGGSLAAIAVAGVFTLAVINVGGSGGGLSDFGSDDASETVGSTAAAPQASSKAADDNAYTVPDAAAPSGGTINDSIGSGGASTPAAAMAETAPSGGSSKVTRLSPEQRKLVDKTLSAQAAARASGTATAGATRPTGTRRVEQSVDMTVRVKSGKLSDATQQVETIVRQGGGYVADSQVSLGTRGSGRASYALKVASSKLDATMKKLADLGTVTSQQQASRDITSSFDTVQRRLDDNAEVRRALLRALEKAETDGQIAALKRRLNDNRSSRASLERQLAQLRTRTNLTDIALTLRAPRSGSAVAEDDDGSWSIGDAVSDAGKALGTVTGVLLVGAAVLLPFALLAAAGWAVYRVRRKRRRESALD